MDARTVVLRAGFGIVIIAAVVYLLKALHKAVHSHHFNKMYSWFLPPSEEKYARKIRALDSGRAEEDSCTQYCPT